MEDEPATPPLFDEEKQRVEHFLRMAKALLRGQRRDAVDTGDFDESIRLADCEARLENQMRERGIEAISPSPWVFTLTK